MTEKPQPQPLNFHLDRNSGGEPAYRAEPRVFRLVRGEAVTFNHPGIMGVTVFIPLPQIFEEQGYVHNMQRVSDHMELVLHVLKNAPVVKGEFDYAVYSHELKRFAIGNSPPRMILDDDDDGD